MTIRKGVAWGVAAPLPSEGALAADDATARRIVQRAHEVGAAPPVIGLTGGDLWRTLGGPDGGADRLRSPHAMTFRVDVGVATVAGHDHVFVAHAVARTPAWGHALVVMNAEWLGDWDVAPRGHPNDGAFELFEARLAPRARLQVRGRLRTGAHLPHPGIASRRVTSATPIDLGRALPVRLDGELVGRARHVEVRVLPDALSVVV